jgi:hypothetical protein
MKIVINEILFLAFSIFSFLGKSNQIRLQVENGNRITSKTNLEKNNNQMKQYTNSNFGEDHIDKNKSFDIIKQFRPTSRQEEFLMQKENMDYDNSRNYVLPSMVQSHRTMPLENHHIHSHPIRYLRQEENSHPHYNQQNQHQFNHHINHQKQIPIPIPMEEEISGIFFIFYFIILKNFY